MVAMVVPKAPSIPVSESIRHCSRQVSIPLESSRRDLSNNTTAMEFGWVSREPWPLGAGSKPSLAQPCTVATLRGVCTRQNEAPHVPLPAMDSPTLVLSNCTCGNVRSSLAELTAWPKVCRTPACNSHAPPLAFLPVPHPQRIFLHGLKALVASTRHCPIYSARNSKFGWLVEPP